MRTPELPPPRWRALYLALCVAVAACGSSAQAEAKPEEEELEILTHALVIEAVLQDFSLVRKDSLAERYYAQLYDRFGISEAGLDELRRRYSQDPKLWVVAADTLNARIEAHRDSLGALLNVGVN